MIFSFKKLFFERGFLVRPKIYGFKIKFLTEIRAVSLTMCVSVSLHLPFLPPPLLLNIWPRSFGWGVVPRIQSSAMTREKKW